MSLTTIQAAIKTTLESVTGIGAVHDYGRFTRNWNEFITLFTDNQNRVNGWLISRNSTNETIISQAGINLRSHEITIKGYYGIKDNLQTETQFQALIELICSALRNNNNLSGNCLKSSPPQVTKVDQRTLNNILVHYAVITLIVDEYLLS